MHRCGMFRLTMKRSALHDCCSIVVYINVVCTPWAFSAMQQWAGERIDAALACHGTYYLPYYVCATKEQFQAAYLQWRELCDIKNTYDPEHKLTNTLIDTYLVSEQAGT